MYIMADDHARPASRMAAASRPALGQPLLSGAPMEPEQQPEPPPGAAAYTGLSGRPRTPLTGTAGRRRPASASRKPFLATISVPPVEGDEAEASGGAALGDLENPSSPGTHTASPTIDAAGRSRSRRLRATPGHDAVGVHVSAFTYASPPRSLAAVRDAEEHSDADGSVGDSDSTRRSFVDDELSIEGTLENLRHQTRGSPSPHETLVSAAQLQRRATGLSNENREYPDPQDPRSDEDFFCDLLAQLAAMDGSWRHTPSSAGVAALTGSDDGNPEPDVPDPEGALLPALLPARRAGPPQATVSTGALYLSPSDGELTSTICIRIRSREGEGSDAGAGRGGCPPLPLPPPPELEIPPHDELAFWFERASECIGSCRERGEDVDVSVRDANGRLARSRGVALILGYFLWRRRKEHGPDKVGAAFFDASRLLCTVWPGAVSRLCAPDCAQLLSFAHVVGASSATVRQAAGDWLAAAAADAATRTATLAAKAAPQVRPVQSPAGS